MSITNAEWIIKNGYKFYDLDCVFNRKEKICDIFIKHICIDTVKVHKNDTGVDTIFKWLDKEHKEQILDDVEKRYLSSVIRPFRDKVTCIVKQSGSGDEYIQMYFRDGGIVFPSFKVGTMYKGMESFKMYTPEELGL